MSSVSKREWERRSELADRLAVLGITPEECDTLRRCSRTLTRWGELECGDGNEWSSWAIERDETTGLPYLVTYPHTGKTYRRRVADREKGALRRAKKIADQYGLSVFHQTDPRGVALYIGPGLTVETYNRDGIAVY